MDKQDSAARLCTTKESIMLGGGYGGTTMELRELDSEQGHSENCLADHPEPLKFCQLGYDQAFMCHPTGHLPVALDEPILGLSIQRGSQKVDETCAEETYHLAANKSGISLNLAREPTGIDQEVPE
jgi:hypothetical protein